MAWTAGSVAATAAPQDTLAAHAAATAGDGIPHGVLAFRIEDGDGRALPARLTFRRENDPEPMLFPGTQAAPDRLAVRRNTIYTVTGTGAVTVPPGAYSVEVGRGLEWSFVRRPVTIAAGATTDLAVTLVHEVDTEGWISGDFHLHTLTHSGHGDAGLTERVITLAGEGVEFGVATDHNHIADYGPVVRALGLGGVVSTVPGNEVSVPIGHFNAFPLDPARPPVDRKIRDGRTLFAVLRAEPNPAGIVPVIQVNHPRWDGIDYFRQAALDPVSGGTDAPHWSPEFDTVEVLNENEGWGYEDSETAGGDVFVGGSRHSALRDWMNLLNRGARCAAVGNSDSHTVSYELAGFPRNFVRSPTDDPAAIDVKDVAAALRRGEALASCGPFATVTAGGQPMGSLVPAEGGRVRLHVRVQAASWIDCDRVRVILGGDEVACVPVPAARTPLRLETDIDVDVPRDSWIVLLVEGDEPVEVFPRKQQRPVRPLAILNPIRVDADGDGAWTAPFDQALAAVRAAGGAETGGPPSAPALRPSERALRALAAAETRAPGAVALAGAALRDTDRGVRLAGARAAARLGDPAAAAAVEALATDAEGDPYLRACLIEARGTWDPAGARSRSLAFLESAGKDRFKRYDEQIGRFLPGSFAREWMVLASFARKGPHTLEHTAFGPEKDPDVARAYPGRDGHEITWQEVDAARTGIVDLAAVVTRGIEDPNAAAARLLNAVAFAQSWVFAPKDLEVPFALGSDDGCRLQVNDAVVLTDLRSQAVDPWTHHGRLGLRQGWNRVLVKVENHGGGFGLAFRVLDDAVRFARTPAAADAPGLR